MEYKDHQDLWVAKNQVKEGMIVSINLENINVSIFGYRLTPQQNFPNSSSVYLIVSIDNDGIILGNDNITFKTPFYSLSIIKEFTIEGVTFSEKDGLIRISEGVNQIIFKKENLSKITDFLKSLL